jgi:hypothetical protein
VPLNVEGVGGSGGHVNPSCYGIHKPIAKSALQAFLSLAVKVSLMANTQRLKSGIQQYRYGYALVQISLQ